MKKSTKILLVLGLVCVAVGTAFIAAAGMMGAGKIIERRFREGKIYGISNTDFIWTAIKFDDWDDLKDWEEWEKNGAVVLSGDGMENLIASENDTIKELELAIGGADLQIKESKDENFYIASSKEYHVAYQIDGNLLKIGSKTEHLKNAGDIILYLPKDGQFREVKLKIGAGRIESTVPFEAESISVEAGAGEVIITNVIAKEGSFHAGAGKIALKNSVFDELETEVYMGELVLSGTIKKEADVDCTMGNVMLSLQGKEEDYALEVQCSAGNIKVGGREFSGIANKILHDDREKELDLKCSMGNISLEFAK